MLGIHALRTEAYPKGYWSAFFDFVMDSKGIGETFLQDHGTELSQFNRPILVMAAETDAICDAKKLSGLTDYFGAGVCRVRTLPCGHFFGRKGVTLCDLAQTDMVAFLSSEVETV